MRTSLSSPISTMSSRSAQATTNGTAFEAHWAPGTRGDASVGGFGLTRLARAHREPFKRRTGRLPDRRPINALCSHRKGALAALDGDPFQFGHLFHRETAALTTKTAVLDPAERRVRFVRHRAIVEMHHPRFEAEGELHRFLHVVGDDASGQAVVGVVGDFERFLVVADLDDRSDGAKALLVEDAHLPGHAAEHGGPIVLRLVLGAA